MYTYVLILFLAVANNVNSGGGGVTHEFESESACRLAGNSMVQEAARRGSYVIAWGCFEKR